MDKEQAAIQRLKEASNYSFQLYGQPLIVTTSGGKDSSVCVALAQRAGIPFEVLHNHTTADAPQTVRFVRNEFKRLEAEGIPCALNMPMHKGKRTSLWKLISQKKVPPTRLTRYCCDILKERGTKGRFAVTGVRWSESPKRRNKRGVFEAGKNIILNNDNDENRQLFESCSVKSARVCNPIIDWTDKDVWDYLTAEKIPYNPLYGMGRSRVGCIGCCLCSKKQKAQEFAIWPEYRRLYILSFNKMLENLRALGKLDSNWRMGFTGEEVMHWYMEDGVLPGQIGFDDLETEEDDD